ncbi:MAG TPA: APC family permease [Actinomycetota bacterium]|nr:APC family permease [Actinomycetota bacterium]
MAATIGGEGPTRHITVRQAAFIGVGSMVGAGIFSLLGAAGEVAGAAVWVSFLLAGVVAGLQGYSFAKFGARYPSAGGLLEYVNRGFGIGHVANVVAWLTYAVNCIITAMVAVSFGSYASSLFTNDNAAWAEVFALAIVVAMTLVNIAGSTWVARLQSAIVFVVVGILCVFSVVTIVNMHPALLAPKDYPGLKQIVSSVALTFFAFLGFGIITFTAKDLAKPSRQLPRAMYLALGIATTIYVAVSLGVFGTLTVAEVVAAGPTAIAEAAKPTLGHFGFVLMGVTALFSTAGATNAGLYPAAGLSEQLASTGQFPPVLGRRLGGRASVGLLVQAAAIIVMVAGFDLSAIASIGSAVALMIFTLITAAHFRVRRETGASVVMLWLALLTALASLLTFVFTELIDEPAAIWTLVAILVLCIGLDQWWTRRRDRLAATPA